MPDTPERTDVEGRIAATVEEDRGRWSEMTPRDLAKEAVQTFQHCDDDPCVCVYHMEAMFRALRSERDDWARRAGRAIGERENLRAALSRKDAALRAKADEWERKVERLDGKGPMAMAHRLCAKELRALASEPDPCPGCGDTGFIVSRRGE